ncbi:uncharacterized protein LOC121383885 [Gigantopelta aegis]|uniref:uncharacterized protein LOC121383885 n=1 Tax=Gigantopelta aegis TaxID=1735272 RepID=UPI001B889BBE|nr:uncharacterized protein LOC121383885 [Gigantopelta aegis]
MLKLPVSPFLYRPTSTLTHAGVTCSPVKSGHRVKIVIGNFSMETDNVRVDRGQVSAQLLNQLSRQDALSFTSDIYWVWQMVHTTETVRTRTYFVGNVTNNGDTLEKKTVNWFVDTRRWKKVLSTKHNGLVKSGSKTELRNVIQNGASVRVALQSFGCSRFRRGQDESDGSSEEHGGQKHRNCKGWFVIRADELELGSSGEVAAQSVMSVSTEAAEWKEFQIKDDPFWRFMVVTIQSRVDVSQWRVGAHIDDGHFSEKAKVNWFVNY